MNTLFKQKEVAVVLFIIMGFVVGCTTSTSDALPTLMPTAALNMGETESSERVDSSQAEQVSAPIEVAEDDVMPSEVVSSELEQATLENGAVITTNPAQFTTTKSEILNISLQHPPEFLLTFPKLQEYGVLGFAVNGDLFLDSEADIVDGTSIGINVIEDTVYAEMNEVESDDPIVLLQEGFVDGFEVEIIEAPTPITVHGRDAARALIHRHAFWDGELMRSIYLVTIIDGDQVITITGDTSLADEAVMVPIFDAMVESLELP